MTPALSPAAPSTAPPGPATHPPPPPLAPPTPPAVPRPAEVSLRPFFGEFSSWAAFLRAFKRYQRDTLQVYRVRTTNSVASCNRARERQAQASGRRPRIVDEALGCYSKSFICTHGVGSASRGNGKRRHAPRSTACPAKLNATLKLVPNGDRGVYRVYVKKHLAQHNHEVNRDVYMTYSEARKVTDIKVLREARRLWEEGMPVKDLVAFLRDASGLPVRRQDVDNMVSRWKNGRDVEEEEEEEEDDNDEGEAQYEVQVKTQAQDYVAPANTAVERVVVDGNGWMDAAPAAEGWSEGWSDGGPHVAGSDAAVQRDDGWVAVATPPEYKTDGHDKLDGGDDGDEKPFSGGLSSVDVGGDAAFVIKRWA